MEFGTNTGRQGTYNPADERERRAAADRLKQLEDEWGPDRLEIGFSGSTGLGKNDAQGWSRLQNAQTEATNIRRLAQGKGPMQVQYGGVMQTRQTPSSMAPLGMYAEDERRAAAQADAKAAGGGWRSEPEEVRTARMRQMQAGANLAEDMEREKAVMSDPAQAAMRTAYEQEQSDVRAGQSYGRNRDLLKMQARDKAELATEGAIGQKRAELDLAGSHPYALWQKQQERKDKEMAASLEALGRIYTNEQNFARGGGVAGVTRQLRETGLGQPPPPGELPIGETRVRVPAQDSADIVTNFVRRNRRQPTMEEIQDIYQAAQGR